MPNDAKLGLVVGVGLVIAVAVVFARTDPSAQRQAADVAPAAVHPVDPPAAAAPGGSVRSGHARTAARSQENPSETESAATVNTRSERPE